MPTVSAQSRRALCEGRCPFSLPQKEPSGINLKLMTLLGMSHGPLPPSLHTFGMG